MNNFPISIVIPVFNEEQNLEITIQKITNVFSNRNWKNTQILFIDDGSTDKSLNVLSKYKKNIDVISHPTNQGYGRALKTGILNSKFDNILIIDSDLTYPIEEAITLIDRKKLGFNMVVGSRQSKHLNDRVIKGWLRKVLNFLVNYATGRKIPDVNSGFRILDRKDIKPYINVLCDTFSFTTSLTIAYLLTGKTVEFIPIKYGSRGGESKVKLSRDILRTLQYIFQMIVLFNPLKLFILLGVFYFIFCLLLQFFFFVFHTHFNIYLLLTFSFAFLIVCFGLFVDQQRLLKIYKFNE